MKDDGSVAPTSLLDKVEEVKLPISLLRDRLKEAGCNLSKDQNKKDDRDKANARQWLEAPWQIRGIFFKKNRIKKTANALRLDTSNKQKEVQKDLSDHFQLNPDDLPPDTNSKQRPQ